MSDIAFSDVLSTNEVFRGNDRTRFLTNDLDAIEVDIQALETRKADSDHTHSGYAAANHIHNTTNISTANTNLNDYMLDIWMSAHGGVGAVFIVPFLMYCGPVVGT